MADGNKTAEDVLYCLLEGGDISRYHMKRTITEQRVAEHSWRMTAALFVLWPDARPNLFWATSFHDCSERVTGDVASPVKWRSPALRIELNKITTEEEERLGIRFNLEVEEQHTLTWLDRFEGCLHCLDEIQMGNRKMVNSFLRYIKVLSDPKLHEAVYSRRAALMKYFENHLRERAVALGVTFPEDR